MAYHDTRFPDPLRRGPDHRLGDPSPAAARDELKRAAPISGVRPCPPEGRLYE